MKLLVENKDQSKKFLAKHDWRQALDKLYINYNSILVAITDTRCSYV